ncbi:hypothetical protein AGMMS49928_23400 [Spirochaetia bacterium]|nr:hypothetical protein AGMMS49928_23400 [Spirochaetia bacterium]
MDQISSPEQLNDYIRVSNPGIWIVLAAIMVFLAACGIWAVGAAIPTTVSTQALAISPDRYVCYLPLDAGRKLQTGMTAQLAGAAGTVARVGKTPLSFTEAAETLPNDYTAFALGLTDWNIPVEITLDLPGTNSAGTLNPVSITTDIVRPLSFLFN